MQAQHNFKTKDNSAIEKVEISKNNIQKYKQDKDFNYQIAVEKENIFTRIYHWVTRLLHKVFLKVLSWFMSVDKAASFIAKIVKILPYLLIPVFIYIIFRFLLGIDLLKLNKKKNAKFPQVDLSDEARIIKEENLQQLIKNAIKDKNYRLAVRYYYLSVLKELIDYDLIEWQPDKTNKDYVLAIKNQDFYGEFRNLTFIYDYVWYGNFSPNQKDFADIEKDFKNFKTQ